MSAVSPSPNFPFPAPKPARKRRGNGLVRRLSGALARAVAALGLPEIADFWLGRLNPLWSWSEPRARVLEARREAAGTTTLVLKTNRHFKGFRAGQHLNLGVEIDGVRYTRSYSPSDAPCADGRVSITVKAVEGGKVSRFLQTAPPGTLLHVEPAFGAMTFADATAPHLLLAAGSGITPMLSLVREQAQRGFPQALTLLYWVRRCDERVAVEELRALAAEHANFAVRFFLTGEAAQAHDESAGRIDGERLRAFAPDFAARRVFACGPHGFVEAARGLLDGHCASFVAEAFTAPPRIVAADAVGSVRVTLGKSGRTLELPRGVALLEALEAQGVRPKHGCRIGICNTCACGKSAGATRDLHNGALQHEPTRALRLCISSAASDLTLDL